MKRLLWLAAFWGLLGSLGAQETLNYDQWMTRGRRALLAENYQGALEAFTQARKLDQNADEPVESLAQLYTSKKLYSLALEEYKILHERHPVDREPLVKLAETYGLLNQNLASIRYFEKALGFFPRDLEIILALSWMYLKEEQIQRGIDLLEGKRRELGEDKSLAMYLAILYSEDYNYDKSRAEYLKSIAQAGGDRGFTALCYYNLSLLEVAFYRFDRAFEAVEQNLALDNRAGGHLVLGELYQNRQDFRKSREELEKADKTDDTPYSKFDLVQIYLQFGYLAQARSLLQTIEEKKDDSWMYNYGITKKKFDRDLNEIWMKVYYYEAALVDFDPKPWFWDHILAFFRKLYFWIQGWFHEMTLRQLTLEIARESGAQGFKTWLNYYKAYENYPQAAAKYLEMARAYELARTSRARGSWLMEEGKLRKDKTLLLQALEAFQVPDENEQIVQTLQVLIPLLKTSDQEVLARELTNRLYKLNPGALRTAGLSLPLQLNVYGPLGPQVQAKILEFAGWCGYSVSAGSRPGVEYSLNVQAAEDGSWRFSLKDAQGLSVFSDFAPKKAAAEEGFLRGIFDRIHRLP